MADEKILTNAQEDESSTLVKFSKAYRFEGKDYTETKTEELAALGHQPELRNAKEATCTEPGYTGDTVCKVCEKVLETGKQTDALGHEFKNGKCTRCGRTAPAEPTTGDSVNLIVLWSVLAGAAIAAAALALILKKKQRSGEE